MQKKRSNSGSILLSISLLASNRKETTKKCLDSLKPILEQVSSELIIVDTGCDQEMQELLAAYTTQIIPFTWCNDFSKARNAGLEKARGEWFLYIDDDEWFSDVTEIVDFFQTGEYRNYGMACYIQRNYGDLQELTYTDCWVSRMIRLEKGIRFVSSIHEYLYPVRGECKLLHSPAKHFGYIFRSDEEKYRHSKRNISLLLDMLEKERQNLRWWAQLAQEYIGIQEYQTLYELCTDGLALIKDRKDAYSNKERGVFYTGRLIVNLSTFRLEEAIADYKEAIADSRNTRFCQARLHELGAEAYFKSQMFEQAEQAALKYIPIYDELHEDETALLEQGAFFVREAFDKTHRNNVYSFLICSQLKRKDTHALHNYFYKIGWEDNILSLYNALIPDILTAFSILDYNQAYVDMASTMFQRPGAQQTVLALLQKLEKENREEFLHLARIFSQVESGHYYMISLRILYADHIGDASQLSRDFSALFGCVIDVFSLSEEIWDIADRYQIALEPFILKISFDQWKKGVDVFCEKTDLDTLDARSNIVKKNQGKNNIRYNYFYMKAAEARIVYGADSDSYQNLEERLSSYARQCLAFYSHFFKKAAFTGDMELLPPSCRAGVCLDKAFAQKDMDISGALKSLKMAADVFPSFASSVKNYLKLLGEAEAQKESEERQKDTTAEMELLAARIKEKIQILKEAGLADEANAALEQLKSMKAAAP